jgi:vacuolar-type H+-ATPase subunit H
MTEVPDKEGGEKDLSVISDLKAFEKGQEERLQRALKEEEERVEKAREAAGKSAEELRKRMDLEGKKAVETAREEALVESKAVKRAYAEREAAARKSFSGRRKAVRESVLKELVS